ncbi:MAG: polysaccharide deacetylase family protein [Actinobacteria bacterium]|nr:polysaccharide deacetylase family protein [Actinomycetota bacterium]
MIAALRAARHGIVYAAPRRFHRREIAITFDDGPSAHWTPAILDLLAAHAAHATFFVLGAAVDGNEAILTRTLAEGHELANHAFSHTDLATLSDGDVRAELRRTSALIAATAGGQPRHFRPPFADTDFRIADLARSVGLKRTVLRSVDPADWREPDARKIAERVLARVRRGSIVCLHDALPPDRSIGTPSRQPTVDALAQIVPGLRARGFQLVTVERLLTWRPR